MFSVPACSECGDVPVPHSTYKLFARINGYLDALSIRVRRTLRRLGLYGSSKPLHGLALPLFRFLAACKLGSLTTEKGDAPGEQTTSAGIAVVGASDGKFGEATGVGVGGVGADL
jgi:hypothetical protein